MVGLVHVGCHHRHVCPDGNHVQHGQDHIDEDAEFKHGREVQEHPREQRIAPPRPEGPNRPVKETAQERAQDVRGGTGDTHQNHTLAPVGQILEVDRYGLGIAEKNRRPDEKEQERESKRAHGVQVFDRIQGQPSGQLCRGVAEAIGDPAVGHLVDRHGEKQRHDHDDQII